MDSAARGEVDAAIDRLLARLGTEIEADAKAAAPVKTGALRESIDHDIDGTGAAAVLRVTAHAPYAAWVELGTNPHIIAARNAPALSFFWERENRHFYGPVVHHPGTKPQPFLAPALLRERAL